MVGSIAGSLFGRGVTNKIKREPFEDAMQEVQTASKNLTKIEKDIEQTTKTKMAEDQTAEQDRLNQLANKMKHQINQKTQDLRQWVVDREKTTEALKQPLLKELERTIQAVKREQKGGLEKLWASIEGVAYKKRLDDLQALAKTIKTTDIVDRSQLFEMLASHGVCQEPVLTDIKTVEGLRKDRETLLAQEVTQQQKQLFDERVQSIKHLTEQFKEYIKQARKHLAPYINKLRSCEAIATKEAGKLGLLKKAS